MGSWVTDSRCLKLVMDSTGGDARRRERNGRRKRGSKVRAQAVEVTTDSIGADSRGQGLSGRRKRELGVSICGR